MSEHRNKVELLNVNPLRISNLENEWIYIWVWREQDSNLRPRGYEPRELPDCSTPRFLSAHCRIRTDDPCFTRAMLWPTELSRHKPLCIFNLICKKQNTYYLIVMFFLVFKVGHKLRFPRSGPLSIHKPLKMVTHEFEMDRSEIF